MNGDEQKGNGTVTLTERERYRNERITVIKYPENSIFNSISCYGLNK